VPVDDLPAGQLARLQVFALRGAARQVLEIPGLVHGDPMSMGVRMADLVFSSRIVGTNTATGSTPNDPRQQAGIAFDNVCTLLSQAGAAPTEVTQVIAFITSDRDREVTQVAFDSVFVDVDVRPRLTFLNAHLPGGASVRLEIIAAVGSGAGA
jgi:enamine deaminase RidA (YjgF/YER057c/UK114 family)